MDFYNFFILFLLFLKFLLVFLAGCHLYYKRTNKLSTKRNEQIEYLRTRIEFTFVALMALLMIYLFNPLQGKEIRINGETKLLLFLFGIILLITAKWESFFKTSILFRDIQDSLR